MRYIKILLFTFALSVALSAQIDTNAQHYYMFVYFIEGEVEQTLGARLAFSTDGVNWTKYNDEKPVIAPKIVDGGGDPLMRDPNILYDSSSGVFHLTWTTQWSQNIVGCATSKDLKNWSEQVMIPVGKKITGSTVCWAPEFFRVKDSIMLYWSTKDSKIFQPYYSMTTDYKHYTTPKPLFSPKDGYGFPYTIIDATLLKINDNKYYLFFKDERTKYEADKTESKDIHFVYGPSPTGPWWQGLEDWDQTSYPVSPVNREGPTAFIIGNEARVVFDPYLDHANTDRSRVIPLANLAGNSTPDSSAWVNGPVMKFAGGNFTPSHGSISEVPRAKVLQLLYGIPDKTKYTCGWKDLKNEDISFVDVLPPHECLPVTDDTIKPPVREYPMGKQNMGCGTGVGLAFIPPIFYKGMAIRRRRKQKAKAK